MAQGKRLSQTDSLDPDSPRGRESTQDLTGPIGKPACAVEERGRAAALGQDDANCGAA
jgi:hypothetical protein